MTLYEKLRRENAEMKKLVKEAEAVVNDFMPNIKNCVLQDYERLNKFLLEAKKVKV